MSTQYVLSEIGEVVDEMANLIRNQPSREELSAFLEKHPWALKYVSNGFSEAEQLREMAQKPGFKIVLHVPSVREAEIRKRHGKPQVSYVTEGQGRRFQFCFEQVGGAYVAISR